MKIDYNDADHSYKIDDKSVLSVTQVMEKAGLVAFSGVPPWILEAARQRGVAVHETLEYWDGDDLDLFSLAPILHKYLKQWLLWIKQAQFSCLCIEKIVTSKKHQYAGTVDRIGLSVDGLTIVDIKTSEETKRGRINLGIQLAGYTNAYNEGKKKKDQIAKRIGVYLTETSFKEIVFTDEYDKPWFEAIDIVTKKAALKTWEPAK